jgi:2,4-dienoyl-CoA reductase-like NADH-dependent reductase (Old Yellow Enzyme family)
MSEGKVAFLALCRPLISEPNLPNRWLGGQGSKNSECLSCNLCLLTLKKKPVDSLMNKNELKHRDVEQITPYLWKIFSFSL